MSKASQYNPKWKGYKGKADRLLTRDLPSKNFYLGYGRWEKVKTDGEWMQLGFIYNVGPKFLRWMLDNDLIEKRGKAELLADWYRLKQPDDLGDLWVD